MAISLITIRVCLHLSLRRIEKKIQSKSNDDFNFYLKWHAFRKFKFHFLFASILCRRLFVIFFGSIFPRWDIVSCLYHSLFEKNYFKCKLSFLFLLVQRTQFFFVQLFMKQFSVCVFFVWIVSSGLCIWCTKKNVEYFLAAKKQKWIRAQQK